MATILQITPHPVFPPRGGRRAFFYLRELAREHEVHCIIPQSKTALTGEREGYTMPPVRVWSTLDRPAPGTLFDLLPKWLGPALQYRWLRRSLGGPAASELLQAWHLLVEALRSKRFDIVIFDHVQTLGMAAIAQRVSPKTIRMFNAHNVDCILNARLAEGTESEAERAHYRGAAGDARKAEVNLKEAVHGFWACSETDRVALDTLNRASVPGYAVPNGIATEVLPYDGRLDKRADGKLLFCASLNYEPNRRGLEWFRERVWPLILHDVPAVRLVVIGYGAKDGDFPELRADPCVDFVGEVDNVVPWYHRTSLAVVPILEGSGTRVKILEAMALGSPVVSTTIGAEGIEARDGETILLRDRPEVFAAAACELLRDGDLYARLQTGGRALVDAVYDWRVVGGQLNRTVDHILRTVKV
jgi:glycosyltransferase involved in cell wall biosynthesis